MAHLASLQAQEALTDIAFAMNRIQKLSFEDQNWILENIFGRENKRMTAVAEGRVAMAERVIDDE